MRMELVLRFHYGRSVPWVTRLDGGALRGIAGPDMVVLRTAALLRGENLKTVSEFSIHEGESLQQRLRYQNNWVGSGTGITATVGCVMPPLLYSPS
jgi:hypothetical protein